MVQQALIVDDSKTARLMLGRMLEKHNIDTAMVESGEEALEFLKHQHPDVIFMDHMMPGMDGFAAVKAIKADPAIASIPIVMHTTKQGDIYVGQARALGAVDLLNKPATAQDLVAVLDRVQRDAQSTESAGAVAKSAAKPAARSGARAALSNNDTMELDTHAIAMAAAMAEKARVEQSRAEQSRAAQSRVETTRAAASAEPVTTLDTIEDSTPFFGTLRQWVLALVWLLPILWLLYLYLPAQKQMEIYRQQLDSYASTLEWSLNRRDSYDYGEAPLSGELLDTLQGLVPRLSRAGFTGTIRLEGHVGEFCLARVKLKDGSDIAMLPEPNQPLTTCTMIGYSKAQAARESVAQSDAFTKYLKSAGLLSPSAKIRVEIVAMGSSQPRIPYPEELEGITTGDWNSIALSNNRVHIALVPD